MFGFFETMLQIAEDSADILLAPVKVVAEVAGAAIEPIADAANEVVGEVREALRG